MPITSPSQGSPPCSGLADTSCTFSKPKQKLRKSPLPYLFQADTPPQTSSPPPAEGVVLITLLQTTYSTIPWDNERDRVKTQQQCVRNLQDVPQHPAFPAPGWTWGSRASRKPRRSSIAVQCGRGGDGNHRLCAMCNNCSNDTALGEPVRPCRSR